MTLPPSTEIEAEAAAWVARLDGDTACESDHVAFQAWLAMSELHRQALERMADLWSDMDGFGDRPSVDTRWASSSGRPTKQAMVQP